ncbi:transposase [Nonomuraea polychroma]|uniref:Transposase n=1 Tax=Nonomuraea polychroma TaxID=46176 RepID=A0A438M8E0_9ACTN|nr:transposase [Nonomuraea polychroma]RVX41868.1 transposase [Nonomuraea polychroma]RVX41885.1 transposase [Nonomuraea polychroma]RVX44864.1 transposase [Nonomuraea polychroma]RVX44929.1 transposase [Nonomuraea polychroma]RVX46885.1 transposase [Nonomuraea polychroma]
MRLAERSPASIADDGAMSSGKGKQGPRADRPRRRTFTPEYKQAILAEYDALTEPGARGALLRREGLYSSHLVEWRRAAEAGALDGLAKGGKRSGKSGEQAELERLRRKVEALEAELARKDAALDLVGKAHALLETLSESAASKPRSNRR